jgi:hypothetical protein
MDAARTLPEGGQCALLTTLGQDVEITVRAKPRKHDSGKRATSDSVNFLRDPLGRPQCGKDVENLVFMRWMEPA